MKSVLISINRPYTDLISSGRKVWEIRKSKPKIPVPFRDYIYETKSKGGCGKVIGDFICDEIKALDWGIDRHENGEYDFVDYYITDEMLAETCLTREELFNYGKGINLYAWHISELKIYDVPKEIGEFKNLNGEPITRPFQSWGYVEE